MLDFPLSWQMPMGRRMHYGSLFQFMVDKFCCCEFTVRQTSWRRQARALTSHMVARKVELGRRKEDGSEGAGGGRMSGREGGREGGTG